ncbi:hypothetical protein [Dyadobacter bucti]|uniref:hypothetical protein n=1 Tax=Dyadobacter bucti TaxID=2572203 RepID=UPI001109853A|nr:hypothetical protein [Dyadobacter bucti]
MSDSKNEISDLCISCGMCCDGTLFDKAFVRDEADRKIADDLGMETFESNGKLSFRQPCHLFSSCCTVYSVARPHTCSAFFCPPVKRFRSGEQTFPDTEQQIETLRQHRDKLLKIASQFPELRDLNIRELTNKLNEYGEDTEKISKYRMLFLILFIFKDIQTKYFKPAPKDTLII